MLEYRKLSRLTLPVRLTSRGDEPLPAHRPHSSAAPYDGSLKPLVKTSQILCR